MFLLRQSNGLVWLLAITAASVILSQTAAPAAEQAKVTGFIRDENNRPLGNVFVYLERPDSGGYNNETPQATTNAKGAFSIAVPDVSKVGAIIVTPPSEKYEDASKPLKLAPGENLKLDLTLVTSRVVVIDYVFQPDKTTSFAAGVKKGTIKLQRPNFGFLFAKGTAHATATPDDLRFECKDGEFSFRNFHVGKGNGFYDAGDVALDSVTEAAEKGYGTKYTPCVVGHTYVVRTLAGEYVKFQVKSLKRIDGKPDAKPKPSDTTRTKEEPSSPLN